MVIAAFWVPKASPPQPASTSGASTASPPSSMPWTYSSASALVSSVAVASPASPSTQKPPFCTRNAPTRSRPMPSTRPAWSGVVSFWATACSSSQVVGMSASVRPAFFHDSVLISSARVEKSFGAQ